MSKISQKIFYIFLAEKRQISQKIGQLFYGGFLAQPTYQDVAQEQAAGARQLALLACFIKTRRPCVAKAVTQHKEELFFGSELSERMCCGCVATACCAQLTRCLHRQATQLFSWRSVSVAHVAQQPLGLRSVRRLCSTYRCVRRLCSRKAYVGFLIRCVAPVGHVIGATHLLQHAWHAYGQLVQQAYVLFSRRSYACVASICRYLGTVRMNNHKNHQVAKLLKKPGGLQAVAFAQRSMGNTTALLLLR